MRWKKEKSENLETFSYEKGVKSYKNKSQYSSVQQKVQARRTKKMREKCKERGFKRKPDSIVLYGDQKGISENLKVT